MYNAQMTADRIKEQAQACNIQMETLQKNVGLSKNAIQTSSKSKNGLGAAFLYALSKELGCSSDYLLGLTDEPTSDLSNKTLAIDENSVICENSIQDNSLTSTEEMIELISMLQKLPIVKRAEIILMIHNTLENH